MINFSSKNIFFYVIILITVFIADYSKASKEIKIIKKIDGEIITNIDISKEYKYLIALNNDLKNIEKEEAFKIAEDSLVREKVKANEIKKFFNMNDLSKDNLNKDLVKKIVKNFYQKLGIPDIQSFKLYLKEFDMSLSEVEEKIRIEILWNQLIGAKFTNQIDINLNELKRKIQEEKLNVNNSIEYDLSEIVFQASDQTELELKVNEIISNIKTNGFSTTANKFSASSTSQFGGKIGKVKESQLSKKIKEELNTITDGQYTQPIKVANGFLILLINSKKIVNYQLNEKDVLAEMIEFEKNKQYERFSQIYFNKIKLNALINE